MGREIEISGAVGGVLRWYAAMGVDEIAGEPAIDWLARGDIAPGVGNPELGPLRPRGHERSTVSAGGGAASKAPFAGAAVPVMRSAAAGLGIDAAAAAARELAASASSLSALAETLAGFDGCGLKATAKNLCFYRGSEQAPVMIIGEAPGRDEDIAGRPFVGRAGQLLDKMLSAAALGEELVHITNIVYWRPPGNRTPSPQEALICRPFLDRQVALVKPRIVLLLGAAAARAVYDTTDGIMKVRGRLRQAAFGDIEVKTFATLHPAYLLRSPAAKRLAWRDLLQVKAELEKERGSSGID